MGRTVRGFRAGLGGRESRGCKWISRGNLVARRKFSIAWTVNFRWNRPLDFELSKVVKRMTWSFALNGNIKAKLKFIDDHRWISWIFSIFFFRIAIVQRIVEHASNHGNIRLELTTSGSSRGQVHHDHYLLIAKKVKTSKSTESFHLKFPHSQRHTHSISHVRGQRLSRAQSFHPR